MRRLATVGDDALQTDPCRVRPHRGAARKSRLRCLRSERLAQMDDATLARESGHRLCQAMRQYRPGLRRICLVLYVKPA